MKCEQEVVSGASKLELYLRDKAGPPSVYSPCDSERPHS